MSGLDSVSKFWLGGDSTFAFHAQHNCNIYATAAGTEVSLNVINGKTYVNGKLGDGRTTFFPVKIGILSVVTAGNVSANAMARDRTFQDRSWQGDISEMLIYNKPLPDSVRTRIETFLGSKYGISGYPTGIAGGARSARQTLGPPKTSAYKLLRENGSRPKAIQPGAAEAINAEGQRVQEKW